MSKGKVIFLYSTSGLAEKPFLDAGYEVWSFDGQNTDEDIGNWHKRWAWFEPNHLLAQAKSLVESVGADVKLVVGFPECTDMAVSGSLWFKKKLEKDPECQNKAAELAKLVGYVGELCGCPWMAENPVSVLATLWRKPNYYFHPYEYGGYLSEDDVHPMYPDYINARDAYPKNTCLWTSGIFPMPDKKPVDVPRREDGRVEYSEQYYKLGGKTLKTKNIRSASPRGFFVALCEKLNDPMV